MMNHHKGSCEKYCVNLCRGHALLLQFVPDFQVENSVDTRKIDLDKVIALDSDRIRSILCAVLWRTIRVVKESL